MRTVDFLGIHVDVCEDTGGVWFDAGELPAVRKADVGAYARIEEMAAPEMHKVAAPGVRVCPRDGAALERYRYQYSSPIELDQCPLCHGIWADEGELKMIANFLANDIEPTPQQMAQAEAAGLLGKMDADLSTKRARLQALNGVVAFLKRPMSGWL